MSTGTYCFFEHTADVGIRASGETLTALFVQCARALVEVIAEDSALKPQVERSVSLQAADSESLLIAWLSELLFLFSTEHFLPVSYPMLSVTPNSLDGRIKGDVFDPARHVQGREVKAITRHALKVERKDNMWHAQAILDI